VPQNPQAAPAPGEFTRIFKAPGATEHPAPSPSQGPANAKPSGGGEFTAFFEPAMTPKPLKDSPFGAGPGMGTGGPGNLQPPSPPKQGPGEFTRVFGKSDLPGGPAPKVAHPAQPTGSSSPFEQSSNPFGQPQQTAFGQQQPNFGGQSQAPSPFGPPGPPNARPGSPLGNSGPLSQSNQPFSAPMSATGAFSMGQPAAPAAPSIPQKSGPGEYTRIFQSPAAAGVPQAPPRPAAPPAIPQVPSKLLPFLVIGGILFLAILIIVLFALMR
jgi:hypothetical protein